MAQSTLDQYVTRYQDNAKFAAIKSKRYASRYLSEVYCFKRNLWHEDFKLCYLVKLMEERKKPSQYKRGKERKEAIIVTIVLVPMTSSLRNERILDRVGTVVSLVVVCTCVQYW